MATNDGAPNAQSGSSNGWTVARLRRSTEPHVSTPRTVPGSCAHSDSPSTTHNNHIHAMESPITPAAVGEAPPVFRINLSLPPSERYVELARSYRDRMRALRGMFDELIHGISPKIPVKGVHWLARLSLRRLYADEETDELHGISRVTDIDMYLLICLNTVLDLLMGCTSGGVRTKSGSQLTMLHFRTLDWGMDPLRDLIVQLEFVRNDDPEKVLATSITYVGYVGVLTGVRQDLSMSLNFRPVHDESRNLAFYTNHLLVLLGMRQSVSSLLRECLFSFPSEPRPRKNPLSTLEQIVAHVPSMPTTAVYLIFSDGITTVTMEKDHRTAIVRSSPSFIIVTNHDQQPGSASPKAVADEKRKNHVGLSLISPDGQVMADLIEDSNERRDCMQTRWNEKVQQAIHAKEDALKKITAHIDQLDQPQGSRSSMRLRKKREEEAEEAERLRASMRVAADDSVAVTKKEAISWLTTFPVLNETTHYATIMDPSKGKVAWVRRFDPDEWEEANESASDSGVVIL
ncbi:beta subunit of N-acylethanolamine-hydrolyzing acid amidase-domain-containing protein [Penicillium canariense]|uniref:ceramidase n=1 Tax=Penicillium canariense TaxID=189055 RepID=A0A9W9II61_9EURO|nr:beta subunit of N-acylethanolamine-hydrolyzing acid amidase-domain-containing protein [Penicillium canariense]KAJ5176872.1 beta subunit of N-acylethanolamine-hydrolyzing acid amidase-domain-containing protein [Penicillium canariense]